MLSPRHRAIVWSLAALTLIGVGSGCSTYRAQPIDLKVIEQTWLARSPEDASVSAFAERLRQRGADVPSKVTLTDGIDLAEAELLALVFNPSLHAARVRAGAATIDASLAGLWDDPAIGVDVLRALEGGPSPWTLLSGVSLSVPISGRLGLAKNHALHLAEADRVALATSEWAQLTVLRDAWVNWSVTTEQQRLAAQFAAEAEALLTIAEQLQAAGELSIIAAREIRIAAQRAQAQASELEANAAAQALGLRAMIGLLPQTPVQFNPSLTLSPDRRSLLAQAQTQSANHSAALRLGLARYQVAEAELRLEIRRQYPDLQLGFAFENDRGDRSLGPSFGFAIPLWNRNQRAIARTEAERATQAAEIEAAYIAAVYDRTQATHRLIERTQRLKNMQSTVVPLVDAQVADVRRLAQLGDLDVPLVLHVVESAWLTRNEMVSLQAEQTLAENRLLALHLPAWMLNELNELNEAQTTGVAP